jgi:thioredoxin reductase
MPQPATLLRQLFDAAVAAASPAHCMPAALSRLPDRNYVVVGAGKAAAAMAREVVSRFPKKTLRHRRRRSCAPGTKQSRSRSQSPSVQHGVGPLG